MGEGLYSNKTTAGLILDVILLWELQVLRKCHGLLSWGIIKIKISSDLLSLVAYF